MSEVTINHGFRLAGRNEARGHSPGEVLVECASGANSAPFDSAQDEAGNQRLKQRDVDSRLRGNDSAQRDVDPLASRPSIIGVSQMSFGTLAGPPVSF